MFSWQNYFRFLMRILCTTKLSQYIGTYVTFNRWKNRFPFHEASSRALGLACLSYDYRIWTDIQKKYSPIRKYRNWFCVSATAVAASSFAINETCAFSTHDTFFRFCSHHDDTPCTGIKLTPHFYCWKLNRNRIRLQIPFKTLTSSSLEQNQCQNSTVIQPPSNDPMKWGGQKKTKTKKQMKSSEEMRKNVISIIIRVSMCPVAPLYSEIHGMNAVRSLFSTFND